MDKALTLLKQKKSNIAEVAYETGFNSPSYFTKCFTEKFGCTPSAFAKTVAA
jgi:AraC-like DNA-binding protein